VPKPQLVRHLFDLPTPVAFEMKCLRRILNIIWQEKNQEQRDYEKNGHKCQHCAENDREETEFFPHVCRMPDDRLIKQVVFGIIDGKNERGRPKKRWTDDPVDWCNKDIGLSTDWRWTG